MNYDIAIIGAGPGGYVAAIKASGLGAKVALIEQDEVGGVCLNRGCIPTKAMIASAHAYENAIAAEEFGIKLSKDSISIDYAAVQSRKDKIITTLRGGIEKLLKGRKIEVIKGSAKFTGPNQIDVGGAKIDARNIIIATGSTWIELPNLQTNGKFVVTSDEALSWSEVPKRLLIVGGGVIGCELACMMNAFGSQVTIVEAMPSILPPVEKEISKQLARTMKSKGISILTDTTVEKINSDGECVKATLSSGEELDFDKVLVAIGRRPDFSSLDLSNAEIEIDERGFIKVDEHFQTNVKGVYAIGDAIGTMMLAHVASAEGIAAVEHILGKSKGNIDYNSIPSPVFTTPEIASVGKTSSQLEKQGIEFETGRFPYIATGKALCDGDKTGQIIVLGGKGDGRLLGVHIFGREATNLIGEAALAIRNGLSAKDLEETIHAHPTLSEALAESAADVYGAAIHKIGRQK